MATKNDITGARLINKRLSKEGEENWDKIFKKPMTHEELVSKMLENPKVSQALAEFELDKSTGEVIKNYKP